jgi:hypothetical protein
MKPGILVLVLVGLMTLVAWCWHPVCVPINPETLTLFTPVPIEQRASESQWGVQTFQKRNGQWCQCKPWLARQMFF